MDVENSELLKGFIGSLTDRDNRSH